MMLPFAERTKYNRAVDEAANSLVSAHGRKADMKAWNAARTPGLTRSEKDFCQAVAIRVSQGLGRAPH